MSFVGILQPVRPRLFPVCARPPASVPAAWARL